MSSSRELDAEEPSECGQLALEPERAELRARFRADCDLGLSLLQTEPAAQDLDERPGRRPAVGQAMAFKPDRAVAGDRLELVEQPALADAGLADEEQSLPPAGAELLDRAPHHGELGRAADEGRLGGAPAFASAEQGARPRPARRAP